MHRRRPGRLALLAVAAAALPAAAPAGAAPPEAPEGWPKRFQLGVSSRPGQAAEVRRQAPLRFRYQYLAGGVDTGTGWATWNPDGTFVSRYVAESRRARMTPVLTYYMLLQSNPGAHGGEMERDLANLRDPRVMRAYYADLALALQRARARRMVVLHVEPDLWGYIQLAAEGDDARTVPAAVASSGDPALADLPDTASGFARAIVRLRDRLAPNVRLAYHLSGWGTNRSMVDPRESQVDLARRSARFHRSLRARFDLVFNDVADRDAGFREHVVGDGGASWWGPGDFHRHARYIRAFTRRVKRAVAIWQIPLGNSTLPDRWGRYRDNRVEWWLGERGRAHVREARRAGIVALLFGAGADGNTTTESDGGVFFRLAREYLRRPLRL